MIHVTAWEGCPGYMTGVKIGEHQLQAVDCRVVVDFEVSARRQERADSILKQVCGDGLRPAFDWKRLCDGIGTSKVLNTFLVKSN